MHVRSTRAPGASAAVLLSLLAAVPPAPCAVPARAAAPAAAPVAYIRQAAQVLTGVQVVAAVPGPDGSPGLVVGYGDRLEIGRLSEDGRWAAVYTLGVPAGVTALAVAALDGGEPEVVAGTGGAGSLVRIRALSSRPVAVPVSGFLFGAARLVVAAELDGRPPAELLALNASGELFVYSAAAGGGYRRIWRTPPGVRMGALTAADLDGDGVGEVAAAGPDGSVVVQRWQAGGLVTVGTAYPWGNVRAMTVAPLPDGPPLLVVVTDRDLVYLYRWDGQRLTARSTAYDDSRRLRLDLDWAVAWPVGQASGGTPAIVVEGAGQGGLLQIRVQNDRLQRLAQVVWPGASPGYQRLPDGRLLVVRPDGSVDLLRPVPADYLELTVDGRAVTLPGDTRLVWEGDLPLVDAEQLGRIVPVSVAYDRADRQAWIVSGNDRVRVQEGVPSADADGVSVGLPAPPRLDAESGRLYVPLQALRALGWQVRYDPTLRRLELASPWPGGVG